MHLGNRMQRNLHCTDSAKRRSSCMELQRNLDLFHTMRLDTTFLQRANRLPKFLPGMHRLSFRILQPRKRAGERSGFSLMSFSTTVQDGEQRHCNWHPCIPGAGCLQPRSTNLVSTIWFVLENRTIASRSSNPRPSGNWMRKSICWCSMCPARILEFLQEGLRLDLVFHPPDSKISWASRGRSSRTPSPACPPAHTCSTPPAASNPKKTSRCLAGWKSGMAGNWSTNPASSPLANPAIPHPPITTVATPPCFKLADPVIFGLDSAILPRPVSNCSTTPPASIST